jgi:hypothetical protein
VPIGPVVCAALFFLAARRIVAYRRLGHDSPRSYELSEMKPLASN